jgi:hypothetical protein
VTTWRYEYLNNCLLTVDSENNRAQKHKEQVIDSKVISSVISSLLLDTIAWVGLQYQQRGWKSSKRLHLTATRIRGEQPTFLQH